MAEPIRMSFGRLCRETRALLDISQAQLAFAVGVSRSHIAGIETGKANASLDLVSRIGDVLGLELQLIGDQAMVIEPRATGLVHSRCPGYVGRRLGANGWLVKREVELVHGRWHGWVDILAFHPGTRTLVVVEIKTRLGDIGALERQLSWYEREARGLASRFGWRPSSIHSWVLALASEEVETTIRRERVTLREGFPARAADMQAVIAIGTDGHHGQRGLALIDPSSRRAAWLMRSRADGRRSAAPYRDYADAVRRLTS